LSILAVPPRDVMALASGARLQGRTCNMCHLNAGADEARAAAHVQQAVTRGSHDRDWNDERL
jgi:hypothetical protein